MKDQENNFFKNYSNIILLLGGIILGSILGLLLGKRVEVIQPLGDIFLNLLFTSIIPLLFFAIASSIANLQKSDRIGRLLIIMALIFLTTVLIAAFLMVFAVYLFPIHQNLELLNDSVESLQNESLGSQITHLLTVNDFFELLSRKHMLAFILFSILVGIASLKAEKQGEDFRRFLNSGNEIMKQLLHLIMKLAPVGLGAYFAYQVGVFGPQLFGVYARSLSLCYGFGFFYFIVFFTLYAFFAGGIPAIKLYWKNNIIPSLTALGTCSSIASIPANLDAAQQMRIPVHIRNMVIPLGSSLHKDGSSIISIIKIAVLFAMFGKDFTDINTILIAIVITVITSIAEGGIPNGGYVGELLVITVYGLPMEGLPIVMIISTLVDPIATLLNVTGDTVAAMLITRFSEGKNWIHSKVIT